MTAPFTVAVDGPAAAGKGTVARAIAAHFGLAHLDTGLLYRAVGRRVLDGHDPVEAARTLGADDLAAPGLRTPEISDAASRVAVIAEVRAALLDFQRAFARRAGGAVLDGRDIGTRICPQAEVKLFVTASVEARAARRHAELIGRGHEVPLDDVRRDLEERDQRDRDRAAAPLSVAEDARVLDTSSLTIDEATAAAIEEVVKAFPG